MSGIRKAMKCPESGSTEPRKVLQSEESGSTVLQRRTVRCRQQLFAVKDIVREKM